MKGLDVSGVAGAERVDWLGHASFRLRGEVTIYIDPWKIESQPRDGSLVLITHSHYDHLSMEDIRKVAREDAVIVAPPSTVPEIDWERVLPVAAGESITAAGVKLEAVPAYNTNKKFHLREKGWVGFVVDLGGLRVYHCGDTDAIEEMRSVDCDGVLIPVSGTYVMNPEEAVSAIDMIHPKWAIPMHYGEIVGDTSDAEAFAHNAHCEVVIKEPVT